MNTHTQTPVHRLALPITITVLLLLAFSHSAQAIGLPDGRTYEMVTPVENNDANVSIPNANTNLPPGAGGIATKRPFQSSLDGNAVVYVSDPVNGGVRNGINYGNSFMATRAPGGGWTQTFLQPFGVPEATYEAFSSDLSIGVLNAGTASKPEFGALPGTDAPGEGYNVLYTHSASSGSYQAFFTTRPPDSSPEEFESYGVPKIGLGGNELKFAGASADFSRLFFEANDALTLDAVDGGPDENNLYESVDGQLSLVNILPDGSSEANATLGAPEVEEQGGPDYGSAISSDGTRAFWTDLNTNDLYVSENIGTSDEKTVQIDASQAGGPGSGGLYWTASSDGSKVFFTDSDTAELTSSTISGSGVNLYEYEVNPTIGQPGVLKDLTPVAEAGVEGVVGASENGEYIFFVATGTLSNNENTDHQKAIAGGDNLYMLHNDENPVFIGTLSPKDHNEVQPFRHVGVKSIGDWQVGTRHRTAEVTPDGKNLVFMSEESLTGYPNEKFEEVYVYDADDNRLSCASCNPNGTPPEPNSLYGAVGAYLPISWSNTALPRWISENGGRVFFDSGEPLVTQDTNNMQDVYEWEREGEGSCTQPNGCVYLLSGGVSGSASYLEAVSANGDDVFMATRAKLAPEDLNENYDLYDARVDGVEPVAPPACTGTGCQGLPSPPPTFATPSSVTFEGVGNFASPVPAPAVKTKAKTLTRAQKLAKALKACHAKQNKHKRATCEAQARKRYSPSVKSKKASTKKTAARKRKG